MLYTVSWFYWVIKITLFILCMLFDLGFVFGYFGNYNSLKKELLELITDVVFEEKEKIIRDEKLLLEEFENMTIKSIKQKEKQELVNEVLKRLEIKSNSVVRKVRLAMIEEIENEIDSVKAD